MQYVIATSKPYIVESITKLYKIVLLENSKDTYTTNVGDVAVFHSYEEAHKESLVDASNHDFVLEMDVAEKIFNYGKYKWE